MKKQRRCRLHGDVVHAMVHQIRTDGVVHVHLESNLQLGSNAVCTGNQHWILVARGIKFEEAPEAADLTKHLFVERPLGKIFDALFGAVSAGDVYACIGVCNGGNWLG